MKKLMIGLFALSLSMATYAAPQDFTLVNESGVDIHYLYVSPSSHTDWGDDILGQDVLVDGNYADITFNAESDAELWDLKAVDGEGGEVTWTQLNLVEISTLTITIDEDGTPTATPE